MAVTGLAACGGGDSGTPVLTWYINPDPNPPPDFEGAFGQAGIAERCSTDAYTIQTQILPQSATEQRIQLLRRLAAEDPAIDLMSLDPVFTAEFADAGYLAALPPSLSDGMLKGAVDGASWDGKLVVAPLWANTQILWYRKSMAEAAGLDMTQPVTWDQIIDAASVRGRQGWRPGQQVRGLRRLDQRPAPGCRRRDPLRHRGGRRREGHRRQPTPDATQPR